jgi:hypothetical protein
VNGFPVSKCSTVSVCVGRGCFRNLLSTLAFIFLALMLTFGLLLEGCTFYDFPESEGTIAISKAEEE